LERVAAALLDKSKQNDARSFVGPRDSFRAEAYERANNHLANETEKTRHGHTFGFEPGGAMIGQFKAGKLSAAMVNANIKGETTYTGDIGSGSGNWRFGLTGRTYMAQSGWSHAHFQSFDGSVDTLVKDGVPLIRKMAGSGLKPELSDGTPILPSKSDDYYAKLIRKGQSMHTHSGRKSAFDVNMPGFPLIPFRLTNFQNDPGGGGNYATVPGSGKTVLMHMSKKPNGSAFIGKSFGIVPKGGLRLTLHDGEIFKVVDKDSVNLLGYDLTKEIIDIENQSQLIAKAPSIIEKLKVISGYTDYEQPYSKPEVVYVPTIIRGEDYESFGSSGSLVSMVDGEESDPFDSLYVGG